MTDVKDEPADRSSPWNWPVEWAVDEKFWREVATRTIAGILTLVFLGLPSIIYLLSTGIMTPNQGIPILIGVGLLLALLLIYTGAQLVIRGVAKRAINRIIEMANPTTTMLLGYGPTETFEYSRRILAAPPEQREALIKGFSEASQKQMRKQLLRLRYRSVLSGVATAVIGAVAVMTPLFNK